MDEKQKQEFMAQAWQMHAVIENSCLAHTAAMAGENNPAHWTERQRLLLADMAIHLLHTALEPGDIRLDRLRDNLNAILTLSDKFLPQAGLKKACEPLYAEPQALQ